MHLDFLTEYIIEPYLFSQEETLPEPLLGASPNELFNCNDVMGFQWAEIVDNKEIDSIRKKRLPYIDLGACGFYVGTPG